MAAELIYTSAEKGLRLGSHGFCTVAVTEGLPANLVERLESLSAYREHYRANGPQAKDNPVSYQYSRFRIGGREYPILSRVGFAGFDHTGRTNKLAHHIALIDLTEQAELGPAAMAGIPGLFIENWSAPPKTLPPRALGFPVRPAMDCPTWAATAGDSGWAGAMAQHTIENSDSIVALIFDPQTLNSKSILMLFNEALAFVPPDLRWDVTFSTYLTDLSLETTCRWRAVVAGSPELDKLRRLPNVLTLDLARGALPPAPDSELAEAARDSRNPYVGQRVAKPKFKPASETSAGIAAFDLDEPHVTTRKSSPAIKATPVGQGSDRILIFAWIGIGVLAVTIAAVAWVLFFGPGTRAPSADNVPLPGAPVGGRSKQAPAASLDDKPEMLPVPPQRIRSVTPKTKPAEPPPASPEDEATMPSQPPDAVPSTTRPAVKVVAISSQPAKKLTEAAVTDNDHPIAYPATQPTSPALLPFTCSNESGFDVRLRKAWSIFKSAGYSKRSPLWSPAAQIPLSISISVQEQADPVEWQIQGNGGKLRITATVNESDVALMELSFNDQGNLQSVLLLKGATAYESLILNGKFRVKSSAEMVLEFWFVNKDYLQTKLRSEEIAVQHDLSTLNVKTVEEASQTLEAKQKEQKEQKAQEQRNQARPTSGPAYDAAKKASDDLQALINALKAVKERNRQVDVLREALHG